MAGSTNRVIANLGIPLVLDEDAAAEVLTPGHLVTYDGSGNLIKNNVASTTVARNFVLEREELDLDIDDTYAIGDNVKVGAFGVGMRVLAWIPSGQNLAKGAYLAADNAGQLVAASSNPRIARAIEAVDLSGNAVASRLLVEIV